MRNKFFRKAALATGVVFFLYACSVEESIRPSEPESFSNQVIAGKYIVVYNTARMGGTASSRSGNDPVLARAFVLDQAVEVLQLRKENIEEVYSMTINGFAARLSDTELQRLRQDNRVSYIEEDKIIMLAPPPGKGPPGGGDGGGSPAQETPWGITRIGGAGNGVGKVAWVIDTGIDSSHPDLNVDASRGFTAFDKGKDATTEDGNGHGTHVAGTIAAINNAIGVVGVAAGATVIPVKVLDSRGSGSYSGVIAGVDFVAANGASGDVANMSLGGGISTTLDNAVIAAALKGIKFALAAGNESSDANNSSPARANGPNIYTISAMSNGDNWASFSNYGNPPVDYCAPGVGIKSTWKGGGYNTISGTSMAAPHAAGVLLLGGASSDGTVNGDPDGNPDKIIHR